MAWSEQRRSEGLSPFALDDRRVALARHRAERAWPHAGGGSSSGLALRPPSSNCWRTITTRGSLRSTPVAEAPARALG